MSEPFTVPWPPEVARQLLEMGIEFWCGVELYERLSSRTRRLGWDPEKRSWAGIPMRRKEHLPPRAFVALRTVYGTLEALHVISYTEDVDQHKNPGGTR